MQGDEGQEQEKNLAEFRRLMPSLSASAGRTSESEDANATAIPQLDHSHLTSLLVACSTPPTKFTWKKSVSKRQGQPWGGGGEGAKPCVA